MTESIFEFRKDLFKAFLKESEIESGDEYPDLNEDANKELSLLLFSPNPFDMEITIDYIPLCKYSPGEVGGENDEWLPGGFVFEEVELVSVNFSIFGEEISFIQKRDIRELVIQWINDNIEFMRL